MTKQKWQEHMGKEYFSLSKAERNVITDAHINDNCLACRDRLKTIRKARAKKDREYAMEAVGLVKCKVNGKTFWE